MSLKISFNWEGSQLHTMGLPEPFRVMRGNKKSNNFFITPSEQLNISNMVDRLANIYIPECQMAVVRVFFIKTPTSGFFKF